MNRICPLFLFLALFCCGVLSAQPVSTPALTDTLMLSELEERDQVLYRKGSDEAPSAVVIDYYESGARKQIRHIVNGKAEGVWIEWYENGRTRFLADWKEGKGDGVWLYFHENGLISSREQVRQDVWHGFSESWYANGRKQAQGTHRNNARHGTWWFWNEDGSVDRVEEYRNGALLKTR